jgi:hypothetical protein
MLESAGIYIVDILGMGKVIGVVDCRCSRWRKKQRIEHISSAANGTFADR